MPGVRAGVPPHIATAAAAAAATATGAAAAACPAGLVGSLPKAWHAGPG